MEWKIRATVGKKEIKDDDYDDVALASFPYFLLIVIFLSQAEEKKFS